MQRSVNAPPVSDSGPDQTVDEGSEVTLDGSKSSDPDDGIDLAINPVTERLLQSPYYVHCRNRMLWDALQELADGNNLIRWLDHAADLIRPDIYHGPGTRGFQFRQLYCPFVSIFRGINLIPVSRHWQQRYDPEQSHTFPGSLKYQTCAISISPYLFRS